MELLARIEWILLQFILFGKLSMCKVTTPMCETCPLTHPQQLFCNSDFVILGKILRIDNFIAPLIRTTRITTATAATAAVPAVSTSTTVRQDKEGQLHVALPSLNQQSSVDALPRQPLQVGSVFKALGSQFTEEVDDGGTGGRHEVPISDVVRYRVLVSKIYKGSKWIRNRDIVDINYIPNEEFCSLTIHPFIAETMLISGTIMSGHLVHHPCDWSIVSSKINFGVHRQLTHVYHRQCHVCTIETKTSGMLGIQKVTTGSSGCVYKPLFYTDKGTLDCEGLYGACKKIQHGCSWAGNQRMRDCIRKRKTRFPSPSILKPQTSPPRHLTKFQYPEMKSSLSPTTTSVERDSDLRQSVDPAENVSEKQEIPMMLLNTDKEDTESQRFDEELYHTPQQEVHADGRKQEVPMMLLNNDEEDTESQRLDEELYHTPQQEVHADGRKQEIPMMLLNNDKEDTESQRLDEELYHTPQQEVHADGRKQDGTLTLTTKREQSSLTLPDPPEKVSPSFQTELLVIQSDKSKSLSAVSSSHTALPHYAFDLPQPHVSSQDAADILEKITQQHLRKKKV